MSYEVYIDVRHHPRHLEDWEQKLTSADRWVEPETTDPTDAERMRAVVASLRSMADNFDPDMRCADCGALRHEHYGYPDRLVHCSNPYGPIPRFDAWQRTDKAADTDGLSVGDQ